MPNYFVQHENFVNKVLVQLLHNFLKVCGPILSLGNGMQTLIKPISKIKNFLRNLYRMLSHFAKTLYTLSLLHHASLNIGVQINYHGNFYGRKDGVTHFV